MARELVVLLTLALLGLSGCASSSLPATPPTSRPLEDVRRLAIVPAGSSAFTLVEHRNEPSRVLDEVLAWHPYGMALRPLAQLVYRGITAALKAEPEAAVARGVRDLTPAELTAEAMGRRLRATGSFDDVRVLASEPVGDERHPEEAIARVTVTSWGVVRVRDEATEAFSSFSDVSLSLSRPGTGVALWEHREDVTGADLIPFDSLKSNRQFAREQMVQVLERAGERLAAELLYARRAGG